MSFKRCVIVLADGSRFDVFSELLAEGALPNIKRHLVDNGSFRKAVSAFPSTTGPAHIPFLTGCLPATCNVPGIRWFDKDLYAERGHGSMLTLGAHGRYRSYVGIETFRINSDIKSDVKSIFELVPKSYCIFNSINKGVGSGNLTRIMRIWYWYYGHMTDRWRFVDKSAVKKALGVFKKDFEFLFVVMPGIDEYSHLAHPRHESAIAQYKYLDKGVGEMAERLKAEGRWDDTIFLIVSDHGLSATKNHFCINSFLESRGIKTFYFPLIYRKDFSAASMVSGNGMAHVYFKRAGGWGGRASFEDVFDMYPGLVDELVKESAVDVAAMTERTGGVVVITKRGIARIRLDAGKVTYSCKGADPLGYGLDGKEVTEGEREFLLRTVDSDYPDAPYQLAHIFNSPRAGDLVLSATPGHDLRVKYEFPEHKASHGSLHREHMVVPIVTNIKLPEGPLRTVDVFPIYLRLMGREGPGNIDGRLF
jgi:hypothetical protein